MLHDNPNAFIGNPLDRAGILRRDPDWLIAQESHPQAEMLIISKNDILIQRDTPTSRLGWLHLDTLNLFPAKPELILLGLENEAPRLAVNATGSEDLFEGLGEFAGLRQAGPYLSPSELSIAGQALWLSSWHYRHQFCARDGGNTVIAEGGFKRLNPRTGAEHYPRTDPVAIVLPVHDDEVCLGRSPHFPPGFYSAFAGYVEACETLEECAVREVKEESGLDTVRLEYIFSQPWPFPSSLMMGFIAETAGKDLTLDPDEIEDARWYSRDEIRAVMNGSQDIPLMIPPPMAIAHQLLKEWLSR